MYLDLKTGERLFFIEAEKKINIGNPIEDWGTFAWLERCRICLVEGDIGTSQAVI
jgi:hypothetical protein